MKWGVPFEAWAINFFGTFVFGLVMGSPLWWGIFALFHFPLRVVSDKNPNFFRELRMWVETKGSSIGATFYAAPIRNHKAAELVGSV